MDRPSDSTSSGPAAILAPVPVDEFLSTHWQRQHLFSRGPADRFSGLLSWKTLNEILAHHWREPFRFRLACRGRDLDPSSYADLGGSTPRIRSKDVTDHLRRGATLSFDGIDELHEPLTRLAESFESFFHGYAQINIYGAWRALHGLDLHRDDEEVFILQIDGRKRWLLYGHSVDAIDRTDLKSRSEPPAGAVLDQTIQPGDLLYIPRGCYHLAVPMNEPALHLTLGIKAPRGQDLLRWMVERTLSHAIADRTLPCLTGPAERLRFSEELRRALDAGLDSDLVAQYVADTRYNVKRRPSFSLPWSATADLLPPGGDFLVMLNVSLRAFETTEQDAASIGLRGGGHTYRFPTSMQWIVEQLDEQEPRPIGRVIEAVAGRVDATMVRVLVGMLLLEDLVTIRAS